MFDSINAERDKRKLEDAQIDSDIIPDESGLDGNYFCNLPVFKHPDAVKEIPEVEYVKPSDQFGFKNLSSYIAQMDKWIEEGKTFK
mmetsp:Transcript_850/g.800  ORF Transcript_850/g.800 Transcript_850/m.800 type:complete len:86 (-) Transcript_850:25-282(-)